MGTIKDGIKWSGACVNGNNVKGLFKNGTGFYKKIEKELYKRRLMIGDIVDNKTLYLDFPDDLMNLFQDTDGGLDIITFENGDTISIENDKGIEECDILYNKLSEGLGSYLYSYYDEVNIKEFSAPSSGEVTSIYDQNGSAYNPYRMIKIEDPNIRPIQVGDKIVNGTKMYFIFPDDNKLDVNLEEPEFVEFTSGTSGLEIGIIGNIIGSYVSMSIKGKEIFILMPEILAPSMGLEASYLSEYTFDDDYGEVRFVSSIKHFAEHILVDTTTLG